MDMFSYSFTPLMCQFARVLFQIFAFKLEGFLSCFSIPAIPVAQWGIGNGNPVIPLHRYARLTGTTTLRIKQIVVVLNQVVRNDEILTKFIIDDIPRGARRMRHA